MEVEFRKMCHSQGVLIPKPIPAQVGLEGSETERISRRDRKTLRLSADLEVRDGVIKIPPIRPNPREGWAEDAKRLAQQDADSLVWPEFANEGDHDLVW